MLIWCKFGAEYQRVKLICKSVYLIILFFLEKRVKKCGMKIIFVLACSVLGVQGTPLACACDS